MSSAPSASGRRGATSSPPNASTRPRRCGWGWYPTSRLTTSSIKVLNALNLFTISNNFADAKSIVTHPATTTHSRLSDEQKADLGIAPGLVRISCGLEDPADLVADMLAALEQA